MRNKYAKIGVLVSSLLFTWLAAAEEAPAAILDVADIVTIQDLIDAIMALKTDHPDILDEKLSAAVSILTEENEYNFLPPDDVFAFIGARAASFACGPSKPVVYVQPAGGFEYKWCVKTTTVSAYMDIYKYYNGVLIPSNFVVIPCTNTAMPGIVRIRVNCP